MEIDLSEVNEFDLERLDEVMEYIVVGLIYKNETTRGIAVQLDIIELANDQYEVDKFYNDVWHPTYNKVFKEFMRRMSE